MKKEKGGHETMKHLKTVEWLNEHVQQRDVRVIDCRFSLEDASWGKNQYENGHIPGSVYFDLEKDLSGKVKEHGGRHPLPNMKNFIRKLEAAGINEQTPVIAYDQGIGAFASRLWWLLKYLGHQEMYVLDGGFSEWEHQNLPISSSIHVYEEESYNPNFQEDIIASHEDVQKVVNGIEKGVLIDSRAAERYLGDVEPIDKKAGHIPTAKNVDWSKGLQNGRFLSLNNQEHRFQQWNYNERLIVYCGSGVTAAPNVLVLDELGYQNVQLYVGSFSDWISYSENEIHTKADIE